MNVVVLEDHPIVAQGICDIVSAIKGVKSAVIASPADEDTAPGTATTLYIVDLELGDGSGFDLIERLRRDGSNARILVYTMHEESWIKKRLQLYEIDGAVAKSEPVALLREAVAAIVEGERYFSPAFAPDNEGQASAQQGSAVSDREKQVLRLICAGDTSEDISRKLGLSLNTVHTYRRRLLEKFNVANTAQLVYVTKGLI